MNANKCTIYLIDKTREIPYTKGASLTGVSWFRQVVSGFRLQWCCYLKA